MQLIIHFRDKIRTFDLFKEEQHPRAKSGKGGGQFVKKGQEGSAQTDRPTSTRRDIERPSETNTGRSDPIRGGSGVRSDGLESTRTHTASTGTEFHEIKHASNTAKKYAQYISESKTSSKFGAAVHVYPEEDYSHMRLFLTPDGLAGFALKGDDIVSCFKAPHGPPGAAKAILELAVQQGGRRLDCFDTVLPKLYNASGFQAVARMPFDEQYQPEGWDYDTFKAFNEGKPDVVFMVYAPEDQHVYRPGDGQVIDDYDDGAKYQQQALEQHGLQEAASEIPRVNKKYRIPSQKVREASENSERDQKRSKAHTEVQRLLTDERGNKRTQIYSNQMREIAYKVAEFLDFVDTHQIYTTDKEEHFTLNGRDCLYAGSFNMETKDIHLYTHSLENTPDYIAGLAAHEITHSKWQELFEAYVEEGAKIDKEGDWDKMRSSDGNVKEQYKNKYPLYYQLHPLISNTEAMVSDDGITTYSREWWRAYNNNTASTTSAVHETFAEMGKLDLEGSLQRLLWYKDSKVYKPIYEIMNSFHSKKMKEHHETMEKWDQFMNEKAA